MTKAQEQNSTYRLLRFVSKQPIKFARFFAKGLAGLVNLLKISKNNDALRLNLKIALPELSDERREVIAKQAVRNELTTYFEFFSIWGSSNQKNIERVQKVHGEHLLHQALAAQKGLVLVVPHFGTWEIMNSYVAQFTEMTIMYKPVKDPGADLFVREARSREGAHLVPTDESGVRQIFKALKQGGTTVILPDHTPKQGGEMIPYFGFPLASSNLSAKLIQKTKAKALLLYAIRNDDGFDMYIEEMSESIYQGTANDGTFVIHQAIEDLVHRYPEHYHWTYKRFKANPKLRALYNLPFNEAVTRLEQLRMEQQIQSTATTVESDVVSSVQ
ncbi:lysophospholipid acyltransferase family protein [Acinetobacter johnsonii]|jgi:KDO2-lipid IV(A) lauroyltransferase|uniref:lysophospholipid acyltransferase family protein n=1 Tax=Acinetobacter johnsonii TaxID=40214 RepID=UPI00301A9F58